MSRWARLGLALGFLGLLVLAQWGAGRALLETDLVERLLSPTGDPMLVLPLLYVVLRVLVVVVVPGMALAAIVGAVWPQESGES